WQTLEKALVLTPSSFGLQPWKFIVITDPALREKLKPASWNQSQVTDCSHHVVFAVKTALPPSEVDRYIESIATTRQQPADSPSLAGLKKMLTGFLETPGFSVTEWATRQAYIALGNFMTSAALLGIDACPMEGIDPKKYDEILGLPALGLTTAVACPAGYRAAGDKYATLAKVRYPASEIIEHR
ncbi:MAG: NAD(P)H-dependent oxidoreductase, partial [Verrucomicrobiae bacterium]|nr:NAD(P)H-dependent oxidoreductase [Verrucomicrobiae bacterium]